MDEMVYHQRDEELRFQFVPMLAQEVRKEGFGMCKIVWRKRPHVHRDRCVLRQRCLAVLFNKTNDTVFFANNLGSFNNLGKKTLFIRFAYTSCYGAGLGERVTNAITDHRILPFCPFDGTKIVCQYLEGFTSIIVIGIDNCKWLMNHIFAHEYGMIGSPRFLASFGYCKSRRQIVQILKDEFNRDAVRVFENNLIAKVLFEDTTDNKDYLTETCLDGIVDRVVHYGFAIGAKSIELLETSITAAHTGSKYK